MPGPVALSRGLPHHQNGGSIVDRKMVTGSHHHETGGSNVGCSHAAECPLFPLLRASLQGWRDYYCDSGHQWQECARYQKSLTGEPVPISLLPNGVVARHLEGTLGGSGEQGQGQGQGQGQAVQGQRQYRQPEQYQQPVQYQQPQQYQVPTQYQQPPSPYPPASPVRPESRRRGGLLARMSAWMRGPA